MAPSQWKFDAADWWLEEHGLIMEKPTFPLPPGKYLVTGDRQVTTVLTIQPKDKDGNQRWELADGATLYDVTHLGCRSARYTPATADNSCSPANVRTTGFPVHPRAAMPVVNGCRRAGPHGSHRRWAALPLTEWPHAGRDPSPRDHADTRTLLLHRVAGAPLEQIRSGRIRLLLPSNAVALTTCFGQIVGEL